MESINQVLSNQNMLILDEDGEMGSVQYAFSGLDSVYSQFQMDLAGAAQIPITRLFGRTVTGLSQTNDADERLYEENIASKQNEELRPQLDKLYPVIAMSDWGEVPDDLDMHFPSIRVLTEEDKADLAEKAGAVILGAYTGGAISQQICGKELQELGDKTGIFTNIKNDDIDKMDEDIIAMGELGAPGEGGEGGENAERKERKGMKRLAGDAALDAIAKRLKWFGMDISIENKAGTWRSGEDAGGHSWKVKLTHDYGYLLKTLGRDGDPIDVFMGTDPNAQFVYVAHTLKAPEFIDADEDKCFLDFKSMDEARKAFLSNYDRPEHLGLIDQFTVREFIEKVLSKKGKGKLITAA
jgi:Protein of unknown function (DUF1073)/Inorganic Pyrophosphatase